MNDPDPQTTRRTFRLDLGRAANLGVLDTAGATFALLIAVKHFEAGQWAKPAVVAAGHLGLVLSLLTVPYLRSRGLAPTRLSALLCAASAAGFFAAAIFGSWLAGYLIGVAVGGICLGLQAPLITYIYRQNYPTERRGQLYAANSFTRSISAVGFAAAGGWVLERNLGDYPWILACFGAAALLCAVALAFMPWGDGGAPPPRVKFTPLGALGHVRDDRLFRSLLIAWMLNGLGCIMCFALSVDYLANPDGGLNYSESRVALLTAALPQALKLVTTHLWGRIFDRLNFFLLRITLNLLFAAAFACIFYGHGIGWIAAGFTLQGIAMGGGNIAWSLWVTKLAPADRVAEYMSVHTFTTGLRGMAAPFLGFWLAAQIGVQGVAAAAIVLILLGSFSIGRHVPKADRM